MSVPNSAPIDLTTLGGDVPLPPNGHEIYNFLRPDEIDAPSESYDPARFHRLEMKVTALQRELQHLKQMMQMQKGKSDG